LKYILVFLFLHQITIDAKVIGNKSKANGSQIFRKHLRKACRSTAMKFTQSHTQSEWKTFDTADKMLTEIVRLCPHKKIKLDKKTIDIMYKFNITYARDSENFL